MCTSIFVTGCRLEPKILRHFNLVLGLSGPVHLVKMGGPFVPALIPSAAGEVTCDIHG